MSNADHQNPADSARDDNGDRILAAINYGLMLVGVISGITVIIAVVLAYIRRDTATPFMLNHFRYQIRTFWYWLLTMVIGFLTLWVLIGALILLLGSVWLIIRAAVGLIRLVDGRLHPDPTGFWV